MTVADLDIPGDVAATIVDPRAYATHRIHDAYTWLRANNPLGVAKAEGFDPFWVGGKHADLLGGQPQAHLFHNGARQATLTNRESDAFVRSITGGSPHLIRSLVQ